MLYTTRDTDIGDGLKYVRVVVALRLLLPFSLLNEHLVLWE